MENKKSFHFLQPRRYLSFLLIVFVFKPSTIFSSETENISLKTYSQLAIPVPNPMDMTKLSPGKSYQVTHPKFILQFFFDGKDIYGIIFKREKGNSIFIHWCFFRSCEESPYDYNLKIADASTPPMQGGKVGLTLATLTSPAEKMSG